MFAKRAMIVILPLMVLIAGCAKPYVKAQRAYWKGDAPQAVEILTPDYNKALEKNSRERNLYLWDMGVYHFTLGDFPAARDCFIQSVEEYKRIAGGTETAISTMKSASQMTYAGDPAEISIAYLFMGFCFYYEQDYPNAMIALKRSLEEDQSKEAGREGDMGVTNFFLGEVYSQLERWDDAAVAYRRVVEFYPEVVPAWSGLYYALRAQGKASELAGILEQISTHASPEYAKTIQDGDGTGIVMMIFGDKASRVTGDFFTGAFRKRKDVKRDALTWDARLMDNNDSYTLYLADNMHTHFNTQGGAGDEAKKQATRMVTGMVMKQIPCVGAFAPDTSADIRYWVTLPQTFTIGYLPVAPGEYNLTVSGYDKKRKAVPQFGKSWGGIEVGEEDRTILMSSGYCSQVIR